ncbi:MAG: hypothetical protein WDO71_18170 [Bacteroidota bacterium]
MHNRFFKKNFIFAVSFLSCTYLFAQPAPVSREEDDLPKDYLSASFHAGRREALRQIDAG